MVCDDIRQADPTCLTFAIKRIGGERTIGNILAAQFHAAAVKAHPEIPREIASGTFATLHGWLRDNIYRHGRKYRPDADEQGIQPAAQTDKTEPDAYADNPPGCSQTYAGTRHGARVVINVCFWP